jgi:hypothetical protein
MANNLSEAVQGLLVNIRVRADDDGDLRGKDADCGYRDEQQSKDIGKQGFHFGHQIRSKLIYHQTRSGASAKQGYLASGARLMPVSNLYF